MGKMEIDRDTLYNLYWKEELPQEEIARQCNSTLKIIRNLFKKFGVPTRSLREALILSYKNKPERKMKIGNTLRGGHIKGHPAWNKGVPCMNHVKEALSQFRKGKPSTFKGKQHSQEAKQKNSDAHKGLPSWHKGIPWSPQMKRKFSEITRRHWSLLSDEEKERRIQAVLIGLWKRPTKPEQSLMALIAKGQFPYKYVGDGTVFLGGKCPDFINTDGKKQIIEVFGTYWHNVFDVAKRTEHFRQYSFDTLVIWEDELRDTDAVISKIKKFSRRKLASVGV